MGALALMPVAVLATKLFVHPSIAKGGMGMLLYIYSVPVLSLALVAWAAASRRLARGPRLASMVAAILLACGVFTIVRSGGVSGDGRLDLHWRWTPTPEDLLLAEGGDEPAPRALGSARGRCRDAREAAAAAGRGRAVRVRAFRDRRETRGEAGARTGRRE